MPRNTGRYERNTVGGEEVRAFVPEPMPPHDPPLAFDGLENLLRRAEAALVRAGLVHVQFEPIHPYLDGNGRIGRLLIALLLEPWKLLSQPILYLSLFFKQHQGEYYRRLDAVRRDRIGERAVTIPIGHSGIHDSVSHPSLSSGTSHEFLGEGPNARSGHRGMRERARLRANRNSLEDPARIETTRPPPRVIRI